jgi:hypothetical protein
MKLSCFLMLALLSASSAFADTELYFVSPQDGDKVSGEFTVSFGLRGMGVAPAGVEIANTGHHHLLIDVDALPPMDAPLPKTEQVRHFGGGQTETTLSLPPGKHTLQLVLGNYSHIPHDPPVLSKKITITVVE